LASTCDPLDGKTFLACGSTHYLNNNVDSGWHGSEESLQEFMATMQGLPFPSPLVSMPGFSNRLIWDDSLHVAYRGFAADWVGSVIVDIFGRGTAALVEAHECASWWAKSHGYTLAIDDFSFDDGYPSILAKAWDVKLLCQWLVSRLHASTFE
ncbi:unnamed protein product, partial [Symbiodinium necroappetens]